MICGKLKLKLEIEVQFYVKRMNLKNELTYEAFFSLYVQAAHLAFDSTHNLFFSPLVCILKRLTRHTRPNIPFLANVYYYYSLFCSFKQCLILSRGYSSMKNAIKSYQITFLLPLFHPQFCLFGKLSFVHRIFFCLYSFDIAFQNQKFSIQR